MRYTHTLVAGYIREFDLTAWLVCQGATALPPDIPVCGSGGSGGGQSRRKAKSSTDSLYDIVYWFSASMFEEKGIEANSAARSIFPRLNPSFPYFAVCTSYVRTALA